MRMMINNDILDVQRLVKIGNGTSGWIRNREYPPSSQ
jgi:hypothetical protein